MKVERSTQVLLITFSPAIAKPMLYAVLFIQLVGKYAGVGEGNLFFFWRGQKAGREKLFCKPRLGAGLAVCKCAFSFAVDFSFTFISEVLKITFAVANNIFAVQNNIIVVDYINSAVFKTNSAVNNIYFAGANIETAVTKILIAVKNIIVAVTPILFALYNFKF